MKRRLAFIILLFICALYATAQITFDSIEKNEDSIIVLSSTKQVYTGKVSGLCRSWDKTINFGQVHLFLSRIKVVQVQGYVLNGKEEGKWVYKTEEGRLRGKMRFKSGDPHGRFVIYYLNGGKFEKGKCKKGILDGVYQVWEEDGKHAVKQVFKHGKEIKSKKYSHLSAIISY